VQQHIRPAGSRQRSLTAFDKRIATLRVSVIAPGAGTNCNAAAYRSLEKQGCTVSIKGSSMQVYDRYPESWGGGSEAPNLESFGIDLVSQGVVEQSDCLVVGSRGGQVVLPTLWKARGSDVPPAIIINGGCAGNLPLPITWPEAAVSFLLLGGHDYFKGNQGAEEYLASAIKEVPTKNKTTAILLVNEMAHMPKTQLLESILQHMIIAAVSWKSMDFPPCDEFNTIISALNKDNWSGNLAFTSGMGVWQEFTFSQAGVQCKQRVR